MFGSKFIKKTIKVIINPFGSNFLMEDLGNGLSGLALQVTANFYIVSSHRKYKRPVKDNCISC